MVTIQLDDDRSTIANRIGATVDRDDLRTSESRRRRLQNGSQRRTMEWGLRVELDASHQTAHVEIDVDDDPKIVVTSREVDQPITGLDGPEWDYLVQRALGWHEDGHVLYSDIPDKDDRLNTYDTGQKGTVHQIWNVLEDGAIERQLTQRWSNAYPLLQALRANLFEENTPGIPDVERGGVLFPVAHATTAVLMDQWMQEVYDISTGVTVTLLDPQDSEMHFARENDRDIFVDMIYPAIQQVVPDVLTTADAVDRNRRIFEFVDEIMPYIENSKADGKSQMNRQDGEGEGGMPDDSRESHAGEQRQQARDLEDVDPDDIEIVDADDLDPDDLEDAIPIDQVDLPDDVREAIEEKVAGDRAQESGATGSLLDEIEEMQDSISAGGDDLEVDEIVLPDRDTTADEAVYQSALRASRPLAKLLKNRLQQEETTSIKRNQRRGRFTGRGGSLVRAARGEKEIKERRVEPDEKNYHFTFVLDGSGSMGSIMSQAEESLGMLAFALEDNGVETMILKLHDSKAKLAKPFGVSTEDAKDQVFTGRTAGGTPLAPAVDLARERLQREGENNYLVVVTDGAPANDERFADAIERCTMPTIGINIGNKNPAAMGRYDRAVKASPGDDLQSVLTDLVQQVMF